MRVISKNVLVRFVQVAAQVPRRAPTIEANLSRNPGWD